MNTKSEELLDALDRIDWFSRVGLPDFQPATMLDSWQQAIAFATGRRDWESFRLERRNDLTAFLHKNSIDRYGKWNEITADLKKRIEPLVHRKITDVSVEHSLPKAFEHCVRWDCLGACMEVEYSDLRPLGFYTQLAAVYLRGHFPCGWDGQYPSGHLLIY
jgi:hypothetical protein